ncbi:MAG: hypothetical protein HY903_01020 [Deltaproteobacteria bacterium]|nr:hypothetical protein [Deltaproteobacteria bacterium]
MIRELWHRRHLYAIDRLFVSGLSRARHARLRTHLKSCDSCRGYYEQVRGLEDALFSPAGLAPAASARLSELVLNDGGRARRAPPGLKTWAPALAMAAALTILVLTVKREPEEQLRARGVATAPQAVRISLFTVEASPTRVSQVSRALAGTPLKRGAVVQVTYSNSDFRHLAVVGIDASGSLHWYHSSAGHEVLQTNVSEEPVGHAWEIDAAPGPLRLFAIFDDQPLERARVEAAWQRAAGSDLRELVELPDVGRAQDTMLLDIQP